MLSRNIYLVLIFLLASCGFTPVYKTSGMDVNTGGELAMIKVVSTHDLNGQYFQTRLEDLLNPKAVSAQEKYQLTVKLTQSEVPIDIQQDRTVTRYKIIVTVAYTLTDIGTNAVVDQASLRREGGYDKVESEYATYVSQEDTVKRVTKELAEDTKLRIMSVLVKR
jgi:hypothetical protein